MYVIAGATGRVGSRAARHLLSRGERVRVLVRREADARRWEGAGAEARVLALTDTASLADALESSRGFFALLPFDLTAADLDAHADSLVSSIAGAVAKARVPYVVMLSSGGADLPAGTGPIVGLHRLEQALLATGTTLTALRSAHFQEKVSDVLDVALGTGVYPVFSASADVPRAMTATSDLGRLVAEALLAPASRSEAVDVLGPAPPSGRSRPPWARPSGACSRSSSSRRRPGPGPWSRRDSRRTWPSSSPSSTAPTTPACSTPAGTGSNG